MKNIVIDTNVLLSDPTSLFKFEEHNITLPTTVLYELDNIKDRRDKEGVTKEAREAIKIIDTIIGGASPDLLQNGVEIVYPENMKTGAGKLSILSTNSDVIKKIVKDKGLDDSPDSQIIAATLFLQASNKDTTLVTQDVNMRLIASANGVCNVEGYKNEKALDDLELLSSGVFTIEHKNWEDFKWETDLSEELGQVYLISRKDIPDPYIGLNIFFSDDEKTLIGTVLSFTDETCSIQPKQNKELMSNDAWGIKPKNIEQALGLDALLDPSIDCAIIFGAAGTGKTILALASAIRQVIDDGRYDKIILTRAIANLDEEIGFTPGTETEKMMPWLGGFTDALEALHKSDAKDDTTSMTSTDYVEEKAAISYKSLNFFRGRSFADAICIIDESQNLTRHQVKSIVTRAGKNCKLVFLGNLAQIDKHYLSPLTSGLTHLVVEMKNYEDSRVLMLTANERSKLAEFGEAHL